MIKTGIIGASTPMAGELIRLLIIHPEVEIQSIQSEELAGRAASSCHHGLIGEDIVGITDDIESDNIDIIFVLQSGDRERTRIKELKEANPELKLVYFPGNVIDDSFPEISAIGLSEINRKELVRGATIAKILPSEVALALIALYPVINYLDGDKEIRIELAVPKDLIDSIDKDDSQRMIVKLLKAINHEFNGKVLINVSPNKSDRVMRVRISTESPLRLEEISDLYETVYDDHNFVFQTLNQIEGREIEGTHKTLINIGKPEPELTEIEIVGDCRMRGGAGDAVHVMNLFFSLYEKVGLQLKPSRFGGLKDSTSRPEHWFA